jgi:hypothetical protein
MGCKRIAAVALLAASLACSTESTPEARVSPTAVSSPTPASQRDGLCQPFPDRLIDDFLAAYNERDFDTLETLVEAEPIEDFVAAAYAGSATFSDVREWAEAGWNVGDRMSLAGYTAFYPTKRGFQMLMTRRSAALRQHGIEAVSTTLDAVSRGCSIESLEVSDIVQAKGTPCAFYEAF